MSLATYFHTSLLGSGGATRDRTADLLNANQALSQLSYSPIWTPYFPARPRYCSSLIRSRTPVRSLIRSSRALPNSKICSPKMMRSELNQKRADRGVGGRRIACYASTSATMSSAVLVGLGRFELPTSPLSGVRSNQLSYRPRAYKRLHPTAWHQPIDEDKSVST